MTTAEILNQMSGPTELRQFVVYRNPKDHPGKFVVREWKIVAGNSEPVPCGEPTAIVDTLAQARARIPADLINVGRFHNDDPAIVEVWT